MFDTPILILAFNRPEETQAVFDRVRAIRPRQLFVAVDGPRINKEGEAAKCEAVRDIFRTQVDWNCELKTLFRDQNLGCRDAISGAISWFFKQVPEGIILEDDCVADLSFFLYCAELLEKYRDTEHVMHITGYRPPEIPANPPFSYCFSKQVLVWGWATWATTWETIMDLDMKQLPDYMEDKAINDYIQDANAQNYILDKWQQTYDKRNTSWAYAWGFSVVNHQGYAIIPNINLIHNIGFGTLATNTKKDSQGHLKNPAGKMTFPLVHPPLNNELSTEENEALEKAIFYKTQKSKWGLIRRRWIPGSVLSRAKQLLDFIK